MHDFLDKSSGAFVSLSTGNKAHASLSFLAIMSEKKASLAFSVIKNAKSLLIDVIINLRDVFSDICIQLFDSRVYQYLPAEVFRHHCLRLPFELKLSSRSSTERVWTRKPE